MNIHTVKTYILFLQLALNILSCQQNDLRSIDYYFSISTTTAVTEYLHFARMEPVLFLLQSTNRRYDLAELEAQQCISVTEVQLEKLQGFLETQTNHCFSEVTENALPPTLQHVLSDKWRPFYQLRFSIVFSGMCVIFDKHIHMIILRRKTTLISMSKHHDILTCFP